MNILVTGGVRSGKNEFAESKALDLSHDPIYISTCEVEDDQTSENLAQARARRGKNWSDMQAPINLAGALTNSDTGQTRLVDSITIWVANLIYHERDWRVHLKALIQALEHQRSPVILISDEIGLGIAPDNSWGQHFLDAVGTVNKEVAATVGEVHFVVSGCPLKIK